MYEVWGEGGGDHTMGGGGGNTGHGTIYIYVCVYICIIICTAKIAVFGVESGKFLVSGLRISNAV